MISSRPDDGTVAGRVLAFAALSYALTWGLLVPVIVGWLPADGPAATALYAAGAFGPSVAALALTLLQGGREAVRDLLGQVTRWRVAPRWYAVVAVPIAAKLVSTGLLVGIVGADLSFDHLASIPLPVVAAVVLVSGFVPGAIGEELGWRGYALPLLQARLGPVAASLLLGVMWAAWHLPIFVVPFLAQADLPLMPFVVEVVAISVVFTWLFNNTRGSVLLAILLHAGNNAMTPVLYPAAEAAGASWTFAWLNAVLLTVVALALVLLVGREGLAGPTATSDPPTSR